MKFHKNSLKLAGVYLAILMFISLFFSVSVYQLSVQELGRGLRRPGPESVINRLPDAGSQPTRTDLLREREAVYQEAKSRVLQRLILINLLILLSGGVLSYYFAHRTLRPIEEAHEAQSRFTADASHELRTPIAAMQTETEVALMDKKLTLAKAKEIMRSNIEELGKLTALSAGLLRLARAEDSQLVKKETNLTEVIEKAVQQVLPLAEKNKILIKTAELPDVKIPAEPASLTEALVIILDNAVKYSPAKSEVNVSLVQDSKHALIKIKDQGIGIKATELPYIFERFYRADSARSKKQADGYGLGLAIAKNIIDMHKGKIDANSQIDKGTEFTISLPA